MRKIIIVFGVLLFWSSAKALTLSEIRTEIRRNMRDTSSTSTLQRYSDALILDYINQGQREVNNLTWAVEKTTEVTVSNGTIYYDMPDDYIATIKVTFLKAGQTKPIELKEESRKSLLNSNVSWETTTGLPNSYYLRQATDDSTMEMAFIPPAATTSIGTATIIYFCQPDALVSDSDVPFNDALWLVPYNNVLVYYVTARLKTIENRTTEAQMYFQLYQATVQVIRDRIGAMPNYNPGMQAGQVR